MNVLRIPGRRAAVIAAAAAFVAAFLAYLPVTTAQAQDTGCLTVDSDVSVWSTGPESGGFARSVMLTNTCTEPVTGWTVSFRLPPGQSVHQHWSALAQIVMDEVIFGPAAWNETVQPGGSVSFGFIGSWTGSYQDPLSCTIDGLPCDGEIANEAPVVTLTGPVDGDGIPSVCPVRLTADAGDPDGSVDRVEFYVNDTLVGTDEQAPYGVDVAATDPVLANSNTAYARVFDDGSPALSADSAAASFTRAVPPPVVQIIACAAAVEVPAGGSASAVFSGVTCPNATQADVTIDGGAGITVSPTSFTISFDGFGNSVTVSAAPGTAGATATLTVTAPTETAFSCVRDVPVTVVDGEPGANQPPEVVQTAPVGVTGVITPCGLTFTADASDPDGAVDRVEFYANGVLVGSDDTAPYEVRVNSTPTPPPGSFDSTAFARAYDDGDPQLSTDSEPVTFQIAIGDLPPGTIHPCRSSLELPAGSSEEIRFAVSPFDNIDELALSVSGDPGVTVSSATRINSGFAATVNAAAGGTGATATITATAEGATPVTMSITVA